MIQLVSVVVQTVKNALRCLKTLWQNFDREDNFIVRDLVVVIPYRFNSGEVWGVVYIFSI